MEEKIWVPLIGYEGLYLITKGGEIKMLSKSIPNRWGSQTHKKDSILKIIYFKVNGKVFYPCVSLSKAGVRNRFYIHRLIALQFIPNPDNKPCINHINGIKTDYRIENLEWCTKGENNTHANKFGLRGKSSLRKSVIDLTCGFVYDSIHDFAKAKSIGRMNASRNLRNNKYSNYKLI